MSLENTFFEVLGNVLTLLYLNSADGYLNSKSFYIKQMHNSFWGICHYYNRPSTGQTAFSMKEMIPKWLSNYFQIKRGHLLPIIDLS